MEIPKLMKSRMKKIFLLFSVFLFKTLWRLRYKVTYKGLDEVKEALKNEKNGVLFMPNHPAIVIDPLVIAVPLVASLQVRPLIVEYMYFHPLVNWAARLVNGMPIPNFHTGFNPIKQRRAERQLAKMSEGLKNGERFLIYPSGTTKQGAKEMLGGAFGAHQLLHENPNTKVVLVRLTGLWGSLFSRALTSGEQVNMGKAIKKSLWILFKNAFLFAPRRKLTVEFELAPQDFPETAPKLELNRYLEDWYNKPFPETGEPLTFVSYAFWKKEFPEIVRNPEEKLELAVVPQKVREEVMAKVSELTKKPAAELKPEMQLIADLGMDSLDLAELVTFLEDRFDVTGIQPGELTTVARLFLIATKVYVKPEVEEKEWNLREWRKGGKERVQLPDGETIPEVFLRQCDERLFDVAAADFRSGVVTYRQLKMKAILLSEKLAKLPGDRIGIMLPCSVAVQVLILACQLANKTPVMINWTVGGRHLDTVVEVSKIEKVLTSWAFLDNLENIDISRIEGMLVILEELRADISVLDIMRAEIASFYSSKRLLRQPRFQHLRDNVAKKEAVVLFTSGTEAMPKGVPLTHKNILSNLRGVLQAIDLNTSDKLLAMLPPFHSFGFVVTGLMPLLSGLKVVYYPNPTESKRLAKACGKWGVTIVASAPTFLKNILQAAEKEHLLSVRLLVSGAEKAPQELYDLALKMCPGASVIEGYGITECSPVLVLNAEGSRELGVGRPIPGVQIKVVHPETNEEESIGVVGLVLASGPNIFKGYLNASIASPFLEIGGSRWYITGDLGKLDQDGYLTLAGRLKRFVKVGGEMLSLAAIEEAVDSSISEKTETVSELPRVVVCAGVENGGRPKLTLFTSHAMELGEVNMILRQKGFSNLVKVDRVQILEAIPVNAMGKVSYRVLEKMVSA